MSVTNSFVARERNHWLMPLALVTAVAMLVFWFPLSTLWHQQAQLNATAAQINAVQSQEHALHVATRASDSDCISSS